MIEEWRSIPGYSAYEVSNKGRVRCVPKLRKPYRNNYGYDYIALRNDQGTMALAVHRLVAMAFIGPAPSPGHVVAHGDGNPANNVPENLRWATQKENASDKYKHDTINHGSRNGIAKLTERMIVCIRCKSANGMSYKEIGEEYGVSASTVGCAITTGWKHVAQFDPGAMCCQDRAPLFERKVIQTAA